MTRTPSTPPPTGIPSRSNGATAEVMVGLGITPGPWAAFRRESGKIDGWFIDTALSTDSTNDYVIADNIVGRQSEANAKAIAAVPKLLEALLPFARYAALPGAEMIPSDFVVSAGSSMAAPQLTMHDCRSALAALRLAGVSE